MLGNLSIITIAYNNESDFKLTYNSLKGFMEFGGRHIVINGGKSISHIVDDASLLIEEPDNGIYDALNKGIELVRTPYVMLLHSGDVLAAQIDCLCDQVDLVKSECLDVLLNDCTIAVGQRKRLMSSKRWKPWMFKLGAQPPHPPIIYRTSFIKKFKYNTSYPVIADFDYLERIFQGDLNYLKNNNILVHMSSGGKTSSGLSSFVLVSREFGKMKGIWFSFFFALTRPIIKLIQMF